MIMNPYSFKRFLQNPERPRHPVQLVRGDSNCIVVHGDLPDCVQAGSSRSTFVSDNLVIPSEILQSPSEVTSNTQHHDLNDSEIGLIIDNSNTTENNVSCYSSGSVYHRTSNHNLNTNLPDIHPQYVSDDQEIHHLEPSTVKSSSELDILPRDLPDFIADGHSNAHKLRLISEIAKQPFNVRVTSTEMSFPSSSIPPISVNDSEASLSRRFSRSYEYLLCRQPSIYRTLPNIGPRSLSDSINITQTKSSTTYRNNSLNRNESSHLMLSCRTNGNVQNFCCPAARMYILEKERVRQQKNQIDTLMDRQALLENELKEAQLAILERDRMLTQYRAETDVKENELLLKIKTLELELATEKLASSKFRWMNLQMSNNLSSSNISLQPGQNYLIQTSPISSPRENTTDSFNHSSSSSACWSSHIEVNRSNMGRPCTSSTSGNEIQDAARENELLL